MVHVSLMEVTPTSGKGTLGTWWFLRQARAWLDKTEHSTVAKARDEAMSKLFEDGAYAHQRLNHGTEGEGSWTKCQGFKPDLRNSDVRHYRGASGKAAL